MDMRSVRLYVLAAVAALSVALAPLASSAHANHCTDVFLVSGADAGAGNRAGANPGTATCQEHVETVPAGSNVTVPGATHAWAAVLDSGNPLPTGTARINGGTAITLTFTDVLARARWESQAISLIGVLPNSTIALSVVVSGVTNTVTYTVL